MPRNTSRVVGPSSLSGAKGMPRRSAVLRWERLDGRLLNSFRALGTGMGAAATLVTADVQKVAIDATAETAVEITAGEVW